MARVSYALGLLEGLLPRIRRRPPLAALDPQQLTDGYLLSLAPGYVIDDPVQLLPTSHRRKGDPTLPVTPQLFPG